MTGERAYLDPAAICGRCLDIVSVQTQVVARYSAGIHGDKVEVFPEPYCTPELLNWVQEMIYVNRAVISTNDIDDTFRAITTWYGDPVCQWHLHECHQRELENSRTMTGMRYRR